MDIKVYNSVKSVKVSKVYISEYSAPSLWSYEHKGDGKFFAAVKSIYAACNNEVIKVEFVKEHTTDDATLAELVSFWAYELLSKTVAVIDSNWHQHNSGYCKDESIVNGLAEPVERDGSTVRNAFNEGLHHYNTEQALLAEQANAEFWSKVESMKEGKE